MDISKISPGQKTHALVILALVIGAATYGTDVLQHGFTIGGLLAFIKSEAVVAALSMIRLAVGKK